LLPKTPKPQHQTINLITSFKVCQTFWGSGSLAASWQAYAPVVSEA